MNVSNSKDIKWKLEWFQNIPKFPKSFWYSQQNEKLFLELIAKKNRLITSLDWKKLSATVIKRNGGTVHVALLNLTVKGLLNKYFGSLLAAVKTNFPLLDWRECTIDKSKLFKTQESLESSLQKIFLQKLIKANYRNKLS